MVLENFGINETSPEGLASFNHHLYMVARGDGTAAKTGNSRTRKAALYRLGAVTGAATRVNSSSSADDFGVDEELPAGLAEHKGRLYMVGETNKRLYEVDADTGVATSVRGEDGASEFGISETGPIALAYHNGAMYFIGEHTDQLSVLDLESGEATFVPGSTQYYGITSPDNLIITDLASDGIHLYGVGAVGTDAGLYRMNTNNGTASKIHPSFESGFNVGEIDPQSLATDGTTTYMIGAQTDKLYTIDLDTGKATILSSDVRAGFGVGELEPTGITYVGAAGSGILYMVGNATNSLYKIKTRGDTSTYQPGVGLGEAERVLGLGVGGTSAITITDPGDLTTDGTDLYVVHGTSKNAIAKIDRLGGVVRVTAPNNATGHGESNITGIAWAGPTDTVTILSGASAKTVVLTVADVLATNSRPTGITNPIGLMNSKRNSSSPYGPMAPDATNPYYTLTASSNGQLYKIDPTTSPDWTTTKIDFESFGLSTPETNPRGLAWNGTNFYMIGQATDDLYTIDRDTGEATNIGGPGFATSEGLDYIGTTLYTLEREPIVAKLHRVITSGAGIGTSADIGNFSSVENQPRALAHIVDGDNTTVYMVGQQHDQLYRLNLTSGDAGIEGIGSGFGGVLPAVVTAQSLVSDGTDLYLYASNRVYKFNLDTQAVSDDTGFGTVSVYSTYNTSTISVRGAAYRNSIFYVADDTTDKLYTIAYAGTPVALGTSTVVGSAVEFGSGAEEDKPRGIAFFNNQLYMVGAGHSTLYRLNPDTGVAVKVGSEVAQTDRRENPQQFTTQAGGNSRLLFAEQSNYYTRVPRVDLADTSTQVSGLNKFYKYIPIVTAISLADQTETISIEFLKGSSSANKYQQGPFRFGGGFTLGASIEGTQLFFRGITNDKLPEVSRTARNTAWNKRLGDITGTGTSIAVASGLTLNTPNSVGKVLDTELETNTATHPERFQVVVPAGYSVMDGNSVGVIEIEGRDYHGQRIRERVTITAPPDTSTPFTKMTRSFFGRSQNYSTSDVNTQTRVFVRDPLSHGTLGLRSQNEEVDVTFRLQDQDFLGGWTVEAQKGAGVVHTYVGVYPVQMSVSLARTQALTYDFTCMAWDMQPYENAAGVDTTEGGLTVGGVNLQRHESTGTSIVDLFAPEDESALTSGDTRLGNPAFKNAAQELYTGWQCQLKIARPGDTAAQATVIPLLDTTFTINQTIEQAELIIGERNPGPLFRSGLREVTLAGTMLLTRERNWIQEFRDNSVFEHGELILNNIITGGFPYKTIFKFGQGQLTTSPDASVDGLGLISLPFNMMFFDDDFGAPTDFYIVATYHQDDWFRGGQEFGGLENYGIV